MDKNSSKTKMLIIIASSMLVIALVLVILIICLNREDKPQTDGTDIIATEVVNNSNNTEIDQTQISDNNGERITTDTTYDIPNSEEDTPAPTETAVLEPVIVTLGEYQGIKVDYSPIIITDSDIDRQLDSLKSEFTEIIDMPDRPFENGDMAIVTFEGKLDGKLIPQLYGVCFQDILGRGYLPDVFEDEIVGRKKGDIFTINMDYPEDFTDIPEVAGKTVVFDISLVDGFIFYTPEIDDAFIKENTAYSTLEEYKTKMKEELQKEQDDIALEAVTKEIKNKVVENATFEGALDSEIKKQYVLRINTINNQYQEDYGIDAATYYALFYGISAEEYTASIMEEVAMEVKYDYVLQKIAEEKGISIEEADELVFNSAIIEGMER